MRNQYALRWKVGAVRTRGSDPQRAITGANDDGPVFGKSEGGHAIALDGRFIQQELVARLQVQAGRIFVRLQFQPLVACAVLCAPKRSRIVHG